MNPGTGTYSSQSTLRLLRRMYEFNESRRDGLPIRPNEERILRMDVREALGITGEGEPWLQS